MRKGDGDVISCSDNAFSAGLGPTRSRDGIASAMSYFRVLCLTGIAAAIPLYPYGLELLTLY
jgi:hypothetical protein